MITQDSSTDGLEDGIQRKMLATYRRGRVIVGGTVRRDRRAAKYGSHGDNLSENELQGPFRMVRCDSVSLALV